MSFYSDNYEVIADYPLRQRQKVFIRDHKTDADRTCRFCGRRAPEAKFGGNTQAHAVPEFLGNRCLYSLNECESCNSSLATNYEDHLSKATIVMRAIARITGKKGSPAYKSDDGSWEIRSTEKGLEIHLNDMSLKPMLESATGPFDFQLPGPSSSQPYIALRAAMALVKAACSVCPHEHLDQLRPAIKCLTGENTLTTSRYPVFYTLTPGPLTSQASYVVLLRRKNDAHIPYHWIIIQFANFRLQTFVPGCPADNGWLNTGQRTDIPNYHYPSKFGSNWPFGNGLSGWLDWASTEITTSAATPVLRLYPSSMTKEQIAADVLARRGS